MKKEEIGDNKELIVRYKKIKNAKDVLWGLLFASPVIIGVLAFTFYPALESLYFSFTDYDMFNKPTFKWLYNYRVMFVIDPDFWTVWKNTVLYAVISIPLNLFLGFFLAQAANFKVKGITVSRTLFYLPVSIPGVASGLLFMDMFLVGPSSILNNIRKSIGLPALSWFS